MKNKKFIYGILAVVIAVVGIGLFVYLNKPTITPLPEGQIIVKQSGGAGILIAECADKSYITETADYIIEGAVEKVESKWNGERTSIFTYTDLRIEKYVKGISFTEDKLQIVTPGGTVGEINQWAEDQPIFHEGKKVRIYFHQTNGEFSIVCAQFGVEDLVELPPEENKEPISCKDSLDCPSGMKCENRICVDIGCIGEGETGPSAGINPEWLDHLPTKCCEGLKSITYSGYYDENCNFLQIAGAPTGVCTKCGDGICGKGETKCNCPEDCRTEYQPRGLNR